MVMETEGKWFIEERKPHINIVEFLAVNNDILAFTREKKINAIHIQQHNCPLVPSENGSYDRHDTSRFKQGHLKKQITITLEYLPGILNTRADWQSQHSKDFSEWKLSLIVKLSPYLPENGFAVIYLFASRSSNQIAKYFAWKPDPHSLATDATKQEWNQ